MPTSPTKVDLSHFYKCVGKMREMPKKVGKNVLNKSVLQVCIGSGGNKGLVHLTRKATEARIREDMAQVVTTVGRRGGTHSVPRIIALAAQWLVKRGVRPMGWGADEQLRWRSEVSQACEAILKARIKSRAFIAAGWLFSARDLKEKAGADAFPGLTRLEKSDIPTFNGGEASKSFAIAATNSKPFAGVFNTSKGAEKIVTVGVIQLAVNGEVRNLEAYFKREGAKGLQRAVRGFDPDHV